jgi:hypothetical protein
VDVELYVFAGRPNPRWALPPGRDVELARLVSQLAEPGAPRSPQLGYQGFVVYSELPGPVPGPGPPGPPWLHVYAGTATVLAGPRAGIYRDSARIERWLVDQAEQAGLSELLDAAMPDREIPP